MEAKTTEGYKRECAPLIEACDKAIGSLEAQLKEAKFTHELTLKALEVQTAETQRLKAKNDAWYRENPWLLLAVGVGVGALGITLIKR